MNPLSTLQSPNIPIRVPAISLLILPPCPAPNTRGRCAEPGLNSAQRCRSCSTALPLPPLSSPAWPPSAGHGSGMEFAPGTNKGASQTCQNRRIWALLSPIALPTQTGAPRSLPGQLQILRDLRGARGPPGGPGIRRAVSAPTGEGGTLRPPGPARPAMATGQSPPGVPELSPGIHGSPQARDASRPRGVGTAPPSLPGGPRGCRAQPRDAECPPQSRDASRSCGTGSGSAPSPSPARGGAAAHPCHELGGLCARQTLPGVGSAQPEPPRQSLGTPRVSQSGLLARLPAFLRSLPLNSPKPINPCKLTPNLN